MSFRPFFTAYFRVVALLVVGRRCMLNSEKLLGRRKARTDENSWKSLLFSHLISNLNFEFVMFFRIHQSFQDE